MRVPWILIPAVAAAIALGCSAGGPDTEAVPVFQHPALTAENAYPDDLPSGSTPLRPAEFAELLDRGEITLLTSERLEDYEMDEKERRDEMRVRARALYADRMEILDRHAAVPDTAHPAIEALPDGNYLFDWSGAGAVEDTVVAHGPEFAIAELVRATETFNTVENQRGVYEQWYEKIDPDVRDMLGLPSLAEILGYDLSQMIALNSGLAEEAALFQVLLPCIPPPDYSTNWRDEVGVDPGMGTDVWRKPAVIPTGLWAQSCFPLKYLVTHVRNQGQRGTCVAFGITAAVEAIVRRDLGVRANLSEQYLYNRAKQIWWPSVYGDGLVTEDVLTLMQSTVFRYPFEQDWDYNRSAMRVDIGTKYLSSCTGYTGEMCSNANHQAQYVCTEAGGYSFCAYVDPANSIPTSSGYVISDVHAVFDPGLVGMAWAKTCLMLGMPVVYCFSVPEDSFSGVPRAGEDDAGLVPFLGIENVTGGHCMVLVGWIDNGNLPTGVPPAAGAGYFIAKNSWGSGFGDGGYVYLPEIWVSTWGCSMFTIGNVSQP